MLCLTTWLFVTLVMPCTQAWLWEIGFYIIQINLGRSLHLPKPQLFHLKYEIHATYVSGWVWGLHKIKYSKWLVHSRHSRNIDSSLLLGMSLSTSQFQNPVILTQMTGKMTSGDMSYWRGFEEKQYIRHYWLHSWWHQQMKIICMERGHMIWF